jgi:TP901 family phage tail tape measure protein
VRAFEDARKATKKTTDDAKKNLEEQKQAMERVGNGAVAMGTLIAAGVLVAVKTFADFDAQMSQVQALSHATTSDMGKLRDAALSMGQGIGFSATQVADAETELVKAGVGVKDMLGGALVGALNLAAAGQIDVAKATQIAAVALTQFKLSGKDVPHIADLLAAGADKALGGVDQLGDALNQGGLVASQFGLTIDDTVGTLSAFANAGLLGSDSGTSFKTMLLSLASPSAKARDTMKELGIAAYDANGQFIGISALAGQLQKSLSGVSAAQRDSALSIIFGTDAIRAANVLYKEGQTGIQGWISNVNDTGFAAEQARAKMDNLNGDVSKLGAAFEASLIKAGSGSNDSLRGLTQTATGLITAFNQAPPVVQQVVLGVAALSAGVLILGGGFLTLTPKIAAARAAMGTLGITGKSLVGTFGKGGGILLALGAIVQGLSGLGQTAQLTGQQIDQLDKSIKGGLGKSFDSLFSTGTQSAKGFKDSLEQLQSTDFLTNQQNNLGWAKFFKSATGGFVDLEPALERTEAQFKQLGSTLADVAKTDFPTASKQFGEFVDKAGGGNEAVRKLLATMPDYKDELVALAAEQGKTLSTQDLYNLAQGKGAIASEIAATATATNTEAIQKMQGQAADATGAIDDLAEKINGFGKAQFDVNATQRDFQAAIDDATESLAKNGATLDITTQAGRENQASLDGIATTARDAAAAIYTQTGSQDGATAAIANGRAELIKQLAQYGITGAAANTYADKLGLIPSNISTLVTLNKTQAQKDAEAMAASLRGIERNIDVAIRLHGAENLANQGGLKVKFAGGGTVPGSGGPKSDSVIAALSSGEEVIQNPYASIYRQQLKQINAGVFPRYANGGTVTPYYMRMSSAAPAGGSSGAGVTNYNTFNVPAIETQDPHVYATIVGREFGRRLAG